MDRVIKFRGFDPRMTECVYGGYYKDVRGKEYIVEKMTIVDKIKPGTIGEFTGFKDIDGKEIYEGDIIQDTDRPDLIYRVEMVGGCWSVDKVILNRVLDMAPFKVIGNIHDNPELCKNLRGCEVKND